MKIILLFIAAFLFASCSDDIVEPKFVREDARQEIKILYKYGFKNEINTFDKTLTKDLVQDGTVTIDFWFQPDGQNKIIEKLNEMDFWTLRDTLNQNSDSILMVIDPDPGIQSLKINYRNREKTVCWFLVNDYPKQYDRLKTLTETILEIVQKDPEYKSLPPAKGAYL